MTGALRDAIEHTTLGWVKPELDETLRQARIEIEGFADDPGDSSRMRFCAGYLHQVQGTLRMVELHAPAMVAEEMEQLAQALLAGDTPDRDSACATLMRGAVLLPDYLERLQSGHKDIPIVLLPLLNELRAARGETGLSESVLFVPDLERPLPASLPDAVVETAPARNAASAPVLVRLRAAIADWPEQGTPADAQALADALAALLPQTEQEPARRMEWVASRVAEAIAVGALPASPALRQVFASVEREARRLFEDDGFGTPRAEGALEPTRQLLYHVAQAEGDHPVLRELREAFDLDAQAPTDSEISHAQGSLSGRNRALLGTVASAVKEDLLRVKDALDLHLRTGQTELAQLQPQVEALGRVADTLGMLGLGVARTVVQQQRDAMDAIVRGDRAADEGALLDVAGALLYVDASLDDQVARLGDGDGGEQDDLFSSESRRVLEVIVREAIANFADARQAFVAFVETSWSHDELVEVPRLLDEVSGALTMLELPRPAEFLVGVRMYTEVELLGRKRVPNGRQLDTFADALASLEYYLEALRDRRGNRADILDIARTSLETLGYWPLPQAPVVPGEVLRAPVPPAEVDADADAADAADVDISVAAFIDRGPREEPSTFAPPPVPVVLEPVQATPAPVGLQEGGFEVTGDEIDDEIREVFLEEFAEEIDNLDQLLPPWRAQPDDLERLRPIRRVFHTLKGSGRLVGARALGEFSWKIESLLNRVLDGTRPPSPTVIEMIDQAFYTLPQLQAALRGDGAVTADLAAMEATADRITAGDETPPGPVPQLASAPLPDSAETPVARFDAPFEADAAGSTAVVEADGEERVPAVVDGLLLEILDAEVQGHLATVDAWLDASRAAPLPASDALLRAIHTMNGAFAMTEVPAITAALAPADAFMRRLLATGGPASADAVEAIGELSGLVRETVVELHTASPMVRTCHALAARMTALRDALPDVKPQALFSDGDDDMDAPLAGAADLTGPDMSGFGDPDVIGALDEALERDRSAAADEAARPLAEAERILAQEAEAARRDAERVAAARIEAERVAAEQREAERLAAEQVEAERLEAERLAAEQVEAERLEAERLAAEQVEAERLEAERLAAEQVEAERLEAERLAAEQVEAERLEAEGLAAEQVEAGPAPASESSVEALDADAGVPIESQASDAPQAESDHVVGERDDAGGVAADTAAAAADAEGAGSTDATEHGLAEQAAAHGTETTDASGPRGDGDATVDADARASTGASDAPDDADATRVLDDADDAAALDAQRAVDAAALDAARVTGERHAVEDDAAAQAEAARSEAARIDAEDEAEYARLEIEYAEQARREREAAADVDAAPAAEAASPDPDGSTIGPGAGVALEAGASADATPFADDAGDALETPATVAAPDDADIEASGDVVAADGVEDVREPGAFEAGTDDGRGEADAHDVDSAESEVAGDDVLEAHAVEAGAATDSAEDVADVRMDADDGVAPTAPSEPRAHAIEVEPDPDAALDTTDLDLELVDIFVEESGDLLDHSDGLLAQLRDAPQEREPLIGLQRDLHTIKGGARMAGIMPIGELGHAMESLLEAVVEQRSELGRDAIPLLEQGFDRLHAMVTRVSARQAVALPQMLIDAFDARSRTGTTLVRPPEPPAFVPLPQAPVEAPREVAAIDEAVPLPAPATARVPAPKIELKPLSAPIGDAQPVDEDDIGVRAPQEQVRIRADLLDRLVTYAGEVAIYRARLEQQLGAFRASINEMGATNARLRDQLRRLDIETEAQIIARYQREPDATDTTFDPLELDRFSTLQQLSRGLGESSADLSSLQGTLDDLTRQYETLLLQQSRVSSDLQEGLMRTRMVPFDALVPRLRRVIRQAAGDTGKQVQLKLDGAQGELDRNVLERMTAPLEHMLRNAVAHGLESPEARREAQKPEEGTVRIAVRREGSEVVLEVGDDGAGLDRAAIRRRGEERGLVRPGAVLADGDLDALIFEPGFSTVDEVSRLAGRGVGMDVVASEVRQLGGGLDIRTRRGEGTTFTLRLPQTLAVTQAVFVRIGETSFAVPIASVRGVGRIDRAAFEAGEATYAYGGEDYAVHDLGDLVGQAPARAEGQLQMPLLLIRSGELRAAVAVDQIVGNREIVVKPVGPQVASLPGIFGATIMGDGRVVVILDVAPLVRRQATRPRDVAPVDVPELRRVPLVMVVDDSVTMRKVTGRVLERHNLEVATAKDGVDALERMVDRVPDLMLLDIEMPRMDGYELATQMKADPRLRDVPIVMITSRTGEKHRQRAFEIGVERYLGKPYQENELMRNVHDLLGTAVRDDG